MKTGIYIHFPVCIEKCDYCAFYSEPLNSFAAEMKVPDAFTLRVIDEIKKRADDYPELEADTIYFGGGTPSILGPERVSAIIECIKKTFKLSPDSEITLEVNPVHSELSKLIEYRDAGINRIVLGVQTLDTKIHGILGRKPPLPSDEVLKDFFSIKDVSHCVDIITGIPGQKSAGYRSELERIVSFRPEHISVYTLSIEEGTPLAARLKPDDNFEEQQATMFENTVLFLSARGYNHYEISNFCLNGYESKHNMKYWKFQPYMGFGPSAHSFVGGNRFSNPMKLNEYLLSGDFVFEYEKRSWNDAMVEYIMTGLRLSKGFSLTLMEDVLGKKVPVGVMNSLKTISKEGNILISKKDEDVNVRLTSEGVLLADSIIYSVVESLLD